MLCFFVVELDEGLVVACCVEGCDDGGLVVLLEWDCEDGEEGCEGEECWGEGFECWSHGVLLLEELVVVDAVGGEVGVLFWCEGLSGVFECSEVEGVLVDGLCWCEGLGVVSVGVVVLVVVFLGLVGCGLSGVIVVYGGSVWEEGLEVLLVVGGEVFCDGF